MKLTRCMFAILGSCLTIMAVDFLTHHLLLGHFYHAHAAWWRPEAQMQALIPFLFASQLTLAILLTAVYAKGYEAGKGGIGQGMRFGFLMGMVLQLPKQLMLYFVYPYPVSLLIIWGMGGLMETVLAGAVIGLLYQPAK